MILILISITRTLSEGWGGQMKREKRLGRLSERRERENGLGTEEREGTLLGHGGVRERRGRREKVNGFGVSW